MGTMERIVELFLLAPCSKSSWSFHDNTTVKNKRIRKPFVMCQLYGSNKR